MDDKYTIKVGEPGYPVAGVESIGKSKQKIISWQS